MSKVSRIAVSFAPPYFQRMRSRLRTAWSRSSSSVVVIVVRIGVAADRSGHDEAAPADR